MSKIDVFSSLLRSTARGAAASLRSTQLAGALRRALSELAIGRVVVRDDQLTRAVGRVPGVAAATVSCAHSRVRVDLSFEDGSQLLMTLRPAGVTFAPGGAKELSFLVEPPEGAQDLRSRDVLGAIAAEIARSLWRPVLARAPRSEHAALVTADGGQLFVDLRSVPEVRWAQSQRLLASVIEALRPRTIDAEPGKLTLTLALDRF
jgi:hypothetical protein